MGFVAEVNRHLDSLVEMEAKDYFSREQRLQNVLNMLHSHMLLNKSCLEQSSTAQDPYKSLFILWNSRSVYVATCDEKAMFSAFWNEIYGG